MKMLWVVFYIYGTQPFTVGSFSSKPDCEFVVRQLIKELQPKKAVCIEVPMQQQQGQ